MKNIIKIAILTLVSHQLAGQQSKAQQIPPDLKKANVAVIKYGFADWDRQFTDSTNGQWISNRYGKDQLYKNYTRTLEEAIDALRKSGVTYQVLSSKENLVAGNFTYLFDYREIAFNNTESIVADRHEGGFFFVNLKTNEKYEPIKDTWHMGRVIKRGINNTK